MRVTGSAKTQSFDELCGTSAPGRSDPFDVDVGPRVHPDALALLDEERDLNHGTGFERGGLGGARGGVALQPGIALRYHRHDERGQLDVDRLAAPEHHVDVEVLLQVLACVPDLLLRERDL